MKGFNLKKLLVRLTIVAALVIGSTGAATIGMPASSAEARVLNCANFGSYTLCTDGENVYIIIH